MLFERTPNGLKIKDIKEVVALINSEKYENNNFDIIPDSLKEFISSFNGDRGLENMQCYLLGKFQGIKQGIAYQKELIKASEEDNQWDRN